MLTLAQGRRQLAAISYQLAGVKMSEDTG